MTVCKNWERNFLIRIITYKAESMLLIWEKFSHLTYQYKLQTRWQGDSVGEKMFPELMSFSSNTVYKQKHISVLNKHLSVDIWTHWCIHIVSSKAVMLSMEFVVMKIHLSVCLLRVSTIIYRQWCIMYIIFQLQIINNACIKNHFKAQKMKKCKHQK